MKKVNRMQLRVLILCAFVLSAVVGDGLCGSAKRHGKFREYDRVGNLKSELVYKRGLLVRKRLFYDNGRARLEERYKGEQLTLRRWFYENGRLKSVWTAKTNVTKSYYRDGRLKAEVGKGRNARLRKKYPSSYLFNGGKP